jgi:hypothetical protein
MGSSFRPGTHGPRAGGCKAASCRQQKWGKAASCCNDAACNAAGEASDVWVWGLRFCFICLVGWVDSGNKIISIGLFLGPALADFQPHEQIIKPFR